MLIFKIKNSPKSNFVIWPLFLTENSTLNSTYRQESKQNKSEIEEEKRTQLFCAIFFILAFIKHVYQQIWRVSNLFNSILHQIKRILLFKINHQWWQWYRRLGQCWPQYLTASKGKQRGNPNGLKCTLKFLSSFSCKSCFCNLLFRTVSIAFNPPTVYGTVANPRGSLIKPILIRTYNW